ncbi:MAG: VIT1/CCC1 transporter family protein [archaeon]
MEKTSIRMRLLVGGAIDGCLTATGVAFGAAFATADTKLVIIAILSAAFSNIVASTFATVTGQLAEAASWTKTLGEKMRMRKDAVETLGVVREFREEAKTNWLVEGAGIVAGSALPALPFFFLPTMTAIVFCGAISAVILFVVGALIGWLRKENLLKYGLIVVVVGLVTAAITRSIELIVELI